MDDRSAGEDLWNRLPMLLVFDRMGHLPQPQGINHPAFAMLRRLIERRTLFDLFTEWAPNERDRHRILVENPETLYGFKKGA